MLRQNFLAARGLKRAVWLLQIVQTDSIERFNGSPSPDLSSIFNAELVEKSAAQVSEEEALSLLAALQLASVHIKSGNSNPWSGPDLLRSLATQTRFQTSPTDAAAQIRALLSAMGAANLTPRNLPRKAAP